MANILIISSNAKDWSKDSGGKERTAMLAEALDGHDVTFLSFNWHGVNKIEQVYHNIKHVEVAIDPATERKYLRLIRGLAKSNYDTLIKFLKPELTKFSKKVKEFSSYADLVILDHYATAPFLEDIPDHVPVIYNSHNAEITMARQLYPTETKLINAVIEMESFAISKAKVVTYCSKKDFAEMQKEYAIDAESVYVPNGTAIVSSIPYQQRIGSRDILFVGSSHPPNVVAAKNLIRVAELLPEYNFVLCGGATANLKNTNLKNFQAMGYVDDNVLSDLFESSFAFINPMETGSGTHLKMMKALGNGMPIITSEIGARGFTNQEIAQSMIIANTADEMVQAIRKLEDVATYEKLSIGSRKVGESYSWEKIQNDYLKVVNDVIANNPVLNKEEAPTPILANRPKVLVYSIIRNRGSNINAYYTQLKSCVEQMPEYEFYLSIYENDSTDNTKKALWSKDWSFFKGVSIISEDIDTPYFGSVKDARRVELLAKARNKAIEAGGFLDKVDYVLMVEGDVSYDYTSVKRLLNFEQKEPNFDIVSSISLRRTGLHYDWWATRTGPVFNTERSEIEDGYKTKEYGRYYSTSNGLCLYRAKPFQEGVRHHWINKVTNEFDCEMVVLCQEFQAHGYGNIFINYKAKAVH
jgi:glycosyltransferase involved in cell wall biosynthesis